MFRRWHGGALLKMNVPVSLLLTTPAGQIVDTKIQSSTEDFRSKLFRVVWMSVTKFSFVRRETNDYSMYMKYPCSLLQLQSSSVMCAIPFKNFSQFCFGDSRVRLHSWVYLSSRQ